MNGPVLTSGRAVFIKPSNSFSFHGLINTKASRTSKDIGIIMRRAWLHRHGTLPDRPCHYGSATREAAK